MPTAGLPFATSVFSVDVDGVAPHCNPVTCVISGIRGSVSVIGGGGDGGEQVTGDIVLIRAGVEHKVVCTGSGINAMYLDGLVMARRRRARRTPEWRHRGPGPRGDLPERRGPGRIAPAACHRRASLPAATGERPRRPRVRSDVADDPVRTRRPIADGKDRGAAPVQGGDRPDVPKVQAMVWAATRRPAGRVGSNSSGRPPSMQALPTRPISPGRSACRSG